MKSRSSLNIRIFGAIIAVLLFLAIIVTFADEPLRGVALLYPVIALLALYAVSVLISANLNPLYLAIGADGLLSVSKAQFMLWNATVLFAYAWIFAAHLIGSCHSGVCNDDILGIPRNALYAMGFSIATLAAAKGITVSYLSAARISKPDQTPSGNVGKLVAKDDGHTPDLAKIQMLTWTLVAVVIYLIRTAHNVAIAAAQLPDIDTPLMVLMGLGQAAYLGNKLTSSDVPILTSISPGAAKPGAIITIAGTNLFGMVTLLANGDPSDNGVVVSVPASATSFQNSVPSTMNGAPIASGTRIMIGINVDGVPSANTLPFTVL